MVEQLAGSVDRYLEGEKKNIRNKTFLISLVIGAGLMAVLGYCRGLSPDFCWVFRISD